jgi:4-hydroxy-3-polyprenylbenzoate decarboxylase
LDPASSLPNLGSKMGIDATTKWKEEGYTREVQQLATVDERTAALVNNKWKEYGFL